MFGKRRNPSIGLLVIAILAVVALPRCNQTEVEEPYAAMTCVNPYHPGLILLVSTVPEVPQGASLPMALVITTSTDADTHHFRSSQRYDFTIHTMEDEELWRWSHDQAFLTVLGEETYTADGVLYFERVDTGELPIEPGLYTLKATLTTEGTDDETWGPAHACTMFEVTAG